MADTFVDFIQRERERLHSERETIFNQQHELETKLAAINTELAAITAYESAKLGKPPAAARQARDRATTTRRGSKREGLLTLLRQNPGGLSHGEILEKMGLKKDKAGSVSVSNALTALTKASQVLRRDGKYRPFTSLAERSANALQGARPSAVLSASPTASLPT